MNPADYWAQPDPDDTTGTPVAPTDRPTRRMAKVLRFIALAIVVLLAATVGHIVDLVAHGEPRFLSWGDAAMFAVFLPGCWAFLPR